MGRVKESLLVDTIEQAILEVHNYYLKVESSKGRQYDVSCSDYVRLKCSPRVNDIAVIRTFPDNWVVVDIKPRLVHEPDMTDEEFDELHNY